MDQAPITKSKLIFIGTISLIIICILYLFQQLDPRTKIVFCNVGQGDATYIRIKNNIDILIDAGPDNKILNCLSRYMPFFDRKIEYAIISHPQKDHYNGFSYLLDRYKIDNIIMPETNTLSTTFDTLFQKIEKSNTKVTNIFKEKQINIIGDILYIYHTKPTNVVDPNETALIALFIENRTKVLFTSDLSKISLMTLIINNSIFRNISILKVPHHGSKNGLSQKILQLADPGVSVISVGKNNSYGHPAKEVLETFRALKMKYLRTDEKGDIEFKL